MPARSQYLHGPSTQKKPAQNLISFLTGGNRIQAYNKAITLLKKFTLACMFFPNCSEVVNID